MLVTMQRLYGIGGSGVNAFAGTPVETVHRMTGMLVSHLRTRNRTKPRLFEQATSAAPRNMNRTRLTLCIMVGGLALLSQGKSMAADVDVLSWESIRKTRPAIYEVLMLSSFNELRKQHPKAVKITRIAVMAGWGRSFAFTLFEQKSERLVLIEITSDLQGDTWHRIKLTEEKDIHNAVLHMRETIGPLKWNNATSHKFDGDDSGMEMFEKYEPNAGHYVINADLPDSSREALADLKRMAERFSKFK